MGYVRERQYRTQLVFQFEQPTDRPTDREARKLSDLAAAGRLVQDSV